MTGQKPVLIYDGRCSFCKIWIDYWKQLTGERIEYRASQDLEGAFPEFSVEFPYLERAEEVDPLTVAYVVEKEDGSRTEVLRTALPAALRRIIEDDLPADMQRRVRVVAAELSALAARLDGSIPMLS